jgi:hypothetical protein
MGRWAGAALLATASLVASGGWIAMSSSGADPLPSNCSETDSTVSCAFAFTGGEQSFSVPAGVSVVQLSATGGAGGAGFDASGTVSVAGGRAAEADATVEVDPQSTLYVEVGGAGEEGTPRTAAAGTRAFNGGGPDSAIGAGSGGVGGGGGGASDVRTSPSNQDDSLTSRLLVAGGGGGSGGSAFDLTKGGTLAAGGAAGAAGANATKSGFDTPTGGQPGTDTSPGAGGTSNVSNGDDGSYNTGGAAPTYGGGGGGGLYGGGSGAAHNYGAGGGGGSSYAPDGSVSLSSSPASVTVAYTLGSATAATVTSVAPASSPAAGGASVVITGSGLTGTTGVAFGGVPATSFTVDSDSQVTAVTPQHAQGLAPLTVTGPGGTSTPIAFTYQPAAPTITSLNPGHGPTAGGTTVVLTGAHFRGATAVDFGNDPATFTVDSDTQITASDPAEPSGPEPVTVTGPGGTSASATFDYDYPAPTITNVDPASGPTAGGTTVVITGTGFTGANSVEFGIPTDDAEATSFTVDSDTQITAVSPAHAHGTFPLVVSSLGGNAQSSYTFVAPATITGFNPDIGPTAGGTSTQILGTGFTGTTAVTFGGTAAESFTVDSDRQITAVTPAHSAGQVPVILTLPQGNTDPTGASTFDFRTPPAITGLSPSDGGTAGGTRVTLTGSEFDGTTQVAFGGVAATSFTDDTDSTISAVAPAHAAGSVQITVTTPYGTSNGKAFSYVGAPSVTSVSPALGPVSGGQQITVTGTGFTSDAAVRLLKGKKTVLPATDVSVVSSTELTAVTPAGKKGSYTLVVVTSGGQSPVSNGSHYKFVTKPGVTSVSPATGPSTGGQSITISGFGFSAGATVSVGSGVAGNVTVVSSSEITATTPAAKKATTTDVHVTTQSGRSPSSPGDSYTYTKAG